MDTCQTKRQGLLIAMCLSLAACSSDKDPGTSASAVDAKNSPAEAQSPFDSSLFAEGALAGEPEIVDCTLSDGTATSCYKIVTAPVPVQDSIGPFCPRTTSTDASEAGIWLDGSGKVYDVDGEFILSLPQLYGAEGTYDDWILYDEEGNVRVTDTREACEMAAVPDVDEAYKHHCVECSLEDVDGGISSTFLIPVNPVPAERSGRVRNVGVSLTGAQLAGPAPVDAILGNYTIAAFDDCGGHINPHEGYHYHAATGCTEIAAQSDGHAALLGYAMDGYPIYGELDAEGNEPGELDECRGQTDAVRGYHYHAASAGENMFIGCFHGLTVAPPQGPGGRPPGPPGARPGPPPQGEPE
ncbi:YHYH protein [Granulosicoccaceae sp. 1_MG-2023]|nr:YHYH protein [Granulosicoccaceae sp. 1_MG-2023]